MTLLYLSDDVQKLDVKCCISVIANRIIIVHGNPIYSHELFENCSIDNILSLILIYTDMLIENNICKDYHRQSYLHRISININIFRYL